MDCVHRYDVVVDDDEETHNIISNNSQSICQHVCIRCNRVFSISNLFTYLHFLSDYWLVVTAALAHHKNAIETQNEREVQRKKKSQSIHMRLRAHMRTKPNL